MAFDLQSNANSHVENLLLTQSYSHRGGSRRDVTQAHAISFTVVIVYVPRWGTRRDKM